MIGLIAGIAITVFGFFTIFTAVAILGFFLLFLGVTAVGSTLSLFRGLPYAPNSGWHTGGDSDVVATATSGKAPSSVTMYRVDKQLEESKKRNESD